MATIGLTDFMQKAKGDVAFLETVEAGAEVKQGRRSARSRPSRPPSGSSRRYPARWSRSIPRSTSSPYLINHDPYGGRLDLSHRAQRP